MNTETEPKQNRSRAALEWARELETKHKIDANALNETLLAHQINDLLESFNLETLKKNMQNHKEYLDLARTILEQTSERTKRLKVELELQMCRENVTTQKKTMTEALQKGLSPETLVALEAAMAKL
jgi:hypothetical protein